ncbi:Nucleoside-diphosphate-sugar epimerase [Arthrobacter sp. cf158]|nr:Nucleoside-diphosphate-sugar epimerase [Arthrobacter sp. cf158]
MLPRAPTLESGWIETSHEGTSMTTSDNNETTKDQTMRIAVTGGSGKLGRSVVRRLTQDGHQVLNIDRAGTRGRGYVTVDLRNYGQVLDVILGLDDQHDGLDAIVHLAAIPAPGLAPDAAIFENNMVSTYNVFQAARRAGIKKVVYASSETVLGLPFDIDPPYIPVDEEYTARPESTYSLVKHLEEQMAIQLTRWDPDLSITALRFSNVMDPEDYDAFPSFDSDATLRKWNLWGYIDARDGALAVVRALEHGGPGFETFIIAAADTVMSRSSAELAAEVFPGVEVLKELGEHETMLSIDKARRLLGFEPEHSWRTVHSNRTTPTED